MNFKRTRNSLDRMWRLPSGAQDTALVVRDRKFEALRTSGCSKAFDGSFQEETNFKV